MSVDFEGVTIGDDGTGFIVPPYQTLRPALSSLIRRLRGLQILNTAPGSFFGQLVDFVGLPLSTSLQNAGQAVSATLFSTAQGVNLDAVVFPFTTRIAAQPSTAELTLYGAPGTNIPANSLVRVNAVGTNFSTLVASGALPAIGNSENYVIEVAPFDFNTELGETFTLDVDGNVFNRVVGNLDTADTIIDFFINEVQNAALSQGAVPMGAAPDTERVAARIAEGSGLGVFPISFTYTGGAPLPFLFPAAQIQANAVTNGPIEVNSLTLREIVTPVAGWQGVSNVNAATAGNDGETDADLRIRHQQELKGFGASNPDAIRARVLRSVDLGGGGASFCSVEYNKTDIVDGAGNLPHSIRVVVDEQPSTPNYNQNIANAIWQARSAGDNMNGAVQEFILDSEGNPQEVLFDFLQNIFIWVQGIVSPGEGFSNVGDPVQTIDRKSVV